MSWSLKMRMVLAAAGMATTVACGGGDKAAPPSATATTLAAAAGGASLAVAEGDFGVPECDSYMKKYLACIDSKVPETARGMLKQGLDQTKAAWKQAAATPQGKAGLAQACTQAEATAKQSTGAYGCSW
ncbi:MAG: hypothetical protein ACHQNV_01020 [Vicinamibacteria bacterium]